MGGGRKKIPPASRTAPVIPKWIPKAKAFQPPNGEGCLRIRLSHLDVGGPFCLTDIEKAHFVDLIDRVKSLESMKRSVVFAPGSEEGKVYAVADLPSKVARDRLVELEYDDQTEIARLRISGERRLYGFIAEGSLDFWALWWDPEHEIWPSSKK